MQNNAKTGGILSIVAGAFGVIGLPFCICAAVMMLVMRGNFGSSYYYDARMPEGFFAVMAAVVIVIGIFRALLGALAIVGGAFALKKKYWGLALAGSIAGVITFFPCGIPAVILTAIAKPEFQGTAPQVPPAPVEKIEG